MSIETKKHNGKEVVLIDWRHCKNIEDALELLETSATWHSSAREGLRTLDIFNGLSGSVQFLYRAKEIGMKTFTQKRIRAAAVGIDELNRIFFSLFNRSGDANMILFSDVDEALNYLAED